MDTTLGQAHCTVLLREDQLLICDQKFRKVGSLYFSESSELQYSNLQSLLDCKPKRHNKAKQMRVGAGEGFAYILVRMVLLANGNR